MSSIKHSLQDSTKRSSELSDQKLEEKEKNGIPKVKNSCCKVGSSKNKEYSETDPNLSINSRESGNRDISLSNLVLAMDAETYNERLRKISVIRRDVKSAIDSLPIEFALILSLQALESEK